MKAILISDIIKIKIKNIYCNLKVIIGNLKEVIYNGIKKNVKWGQVGYAFQLSKANNTSKLL